MDNQTLINIAIAISGALGGWVLNSLRDSIAALHRQDEMLTDKVQSIEVLVAGAYVRRDELERFADSIRKQLDRIEAKLDGKQDK